MNMNHFPNDSPGPFEMSPAEGASSRRFATSMEAFWRSLHQILAHQVPTGWTGYRCEIEVGRDRTTGKYIVLARFLDGVSNRAKNIESREILDLIHCLHEAYRRFDASLEWRKVSLDHYWGDTEKQWFDRTRWEYGRIYLEAETGDNNLG